MAALEEHLTPDEQQLLDSLQGTLPPMRTSLGYRVGMVFVAAVMALMLLIYLGLIGGLGWAVVVHITEHAHWLKAGPWSALVFYPLPILAGLIVLLFLIKPLFRGGEEQEEFHRLSEAEQPLLHAFVYKLADMMGTPRPEVIQVDCNVNAAAGFLPTFLGVARGQLVLTLGLPLLAGLELKQLSGVLAHEFGHFAQDAGMRLTFLIRTFYIWFFRIAHERDQWDEKLIVWSEQWPIFVSFPLWVARFLLWCTRFVLQVVMFLGQIIGSYMLRQMEYDADRYEAALVGAEVFEQSSRSLRHLEYAMQKSMADLRHAWDGGSLTTDFPHLIALNKENLNEEELEEIKERMEDGEDSLFAIHPSDLERIEAVRETAPTALFSSEEKAGVLLRDFRPLSEQLSLELYERLFGEEWKQKVMETPEQTLARQGELVAGRDAVSRYFQDTLLEPHPLFLEGEEVEPLERGEIEDTVEDLKELRHEFMRKLLSFNRLLDAYTEAESQLVRAVVSQAIMMAGFQTPDPELMSLAECEDLASESGLVQEELEEEMIEFRQLSRERLATALSLLSTKEWESGLEEAEAWREELPRLMKALTRLESIFPEHLLPMRHDIFALEALITVMEGNESHGPLLAELADLATHFHPTMDKARRKIWGTSYPFEHQEGDISIGTFALKEMPEEDDIDGILRNAPVFVERLFLLYLRILGRLCLFAEAVELAVGLRALKMPD
jgi:Zn-dependent protease with chaperone function